MKKIWFVALVVLQFSALAQQEGDIEKYMPSQIIDKVEIVAGPNINFPNDHGYGDYIKNAPSSAPATDELKVKIGYSVGFGIAHSIGKRFELHTRALLERKGYKEEVTVDGGVNNFHKGEYTTRNDYFTLSVLPRVYIGKKSRIHLFSGAYYSWLLKSFRKEYTYLNDQVTQVTSTTNDPGIHKFEVGVCGGVGYSFRFSPTNYLAIQVQGNYGLSDIVNVNRVRITCSSISLSIAYRRDCQFKNKYTTN
jgi:hypothetical protein